MVLAILIMPLGVSASATSTPTSTPVIVVPETQTHSVAQGASWGKVDQIFRNLLGVLFTSFVRDFTVVATNVNTGEEYQTMEVFEKKDKVTYPSVWLDVPFGTYDVYSVGCLFRDYMGRSGCYKTFTNRLIIK